MIPSKFNRAIVLAALVFSLPPSAQGQTVEGNPPPTNAPAPPASTIPRVAGPITSTTAPAIPILTLFTDPENAAMDLDGPSSITGRTPVDLPSTVTGRYSIVVQGAGFSRTQGVVFLPPRGSLPFVVSEPPGL